jgi:hypothetical protein
MERIFADVWEEPCKDCNGKGFAEVFSEIFQEKVEDLALRYPTFEQAVIIARDKYGDEISQKTCPSCNGAKMVPNRHGKVLISNKDRIVKFLQKQQLI